MSSKIDLPFSITCDYKICSNIGRGAFGVVYLVREKYSGSLYAMKVINKTGTGRSVSTEGYFMLHLNHPHITCLHEYQETYNMSCLIMEYMRGGNLRERFERNGKLSENLSKLYFYQLCKAVEYLHDNNITHRDLKPENILLASYHNKTLLKITDFGSSIQCYNYMYSCVGTKIYLAPEVLQRAKYGKKVDVWSLGVILYECLSSVFPFVSEEDILDGNYNFCHPKWSSVSDCAKSLIKSIFKVDAARRCNIIYVLKHPWLDDDVTQDTVRNLQNRFA